MAASVVSIKCKVHNNTCTCISFPSMWNSKGLLVCTMCMYIYMYSYLREVHLVHHRFPGCAHEQARGKVVELHVNGWWTPIHAQRSTEHLDCCSMQLSTLILTHLIILTPTCTLVLLASLWYYRRPFILLTISLRQLLNRKSWSHRQRRSLTRQRRTWQRWRVRLPHQRLWNDHPRRHQRHHKRKVSNWFRICCGVCVCVL